MRTPDLDKVVWVLYLIPTCPIVLLYWFLLFTNSETNKAIFTFSNVIYVILYYKIPRTKAGAIHGGFRRILNAENSAAFPDIHMTYPSNVFDISASYVYTKLLKMVNPIIIVVWWRLYSSNLWPPVCDVRRPPKIILHILSKCLQHVNFWCRNLHLNRQSVPTCLSTFTSCSIKLGRLIYLSNRFQFIVFEI